MSKLFQKTISLTFTVEHVSDDPAYEKRLATAVDDVVFLATKTTQDLFCDMFAARDLANPIIAGGWGVEQDPQAISDAVYRLRDAIIADINNEWPRGEAAGLIQKIEAIADEVAEKTK